MNEKYFENNEVLIIPPENYNIIVERADEYEDKIIPENPKALYKLELYSIYCNCRENLKTGETVPLSFYGKFSDEQMGFVIDKEALDSMIAMDKMPKYPTDADEVVAIFSADNTRKLKEDFLFEVLKTDEEDTKKTDIRNFINNSREKSLLNQFVKKDDIKKKGKKLNKLSISIDRKILNGKALFGIIKIRKFYKDKHSFRFIDKEYEFREIEKLSALDIQGDKRNVVFVHGLGSDVHKNFRGLHNALKDHFNIYAFSYPTVRVGIRENAYMLQNYLKKHFGDKKVWVFAHSMGGLVSRKAIILGAPIDMLLMAGTPNNGSSLAIGAHFLHSLKDTVEDLLYLKHKSPGLKDLKKDSSFVSDLNFEEIYRETHKDILYLVLWSKWLSRSGDGVVKAKNISTIIADFVYENRDHIYAGEEMNCFHTGYFKNQKNIEVTLEILLTKYLL
ncbi:alpha/beta hydrolase [Peribacillus frigoritolerans]|uniref:esterase/lipase family protein n=1 Tax=Peribacillus frigoritolerans TaxID=450367 RepID=UPI002ED2FF29|nr:alpha/beta hydrolase [Peribacillus frigoritolerans]